MAKITNRRKLLVAVCAILTVNAAAAADYPIKPIRIIAPFPPASVADVLARPIAQKMAETWGQPVIVDNRAGAAGNVGAELVAKAPPDGYTLLLGTIGTNAVNAALYAKLPYNAQKDFAPVSQVATSYLLLVMHPSVPVRTVKDVIALAKSQPVPLNFGSAGVGTTPYLAGEMFKVMAGVPMTHVAYKGSPQSAIDLGGGTAGPHFCERLHGVAVDTRGPPAPYRHQRRPARSRNAGHSGRQRNASRF